MRISNSLSAPVRATLLASSALFLTLGSNSAWAQDTAASKDPSAEEEDSYALGDDSARSEARPILADLVEARQAFRPVTISGPDFGVETPAVTINNNFVPNDIRDPNNITGIGQMITDSGGGFIGTCTGTLINPRTVIFAAHCVNTREATAYGANSGGVGIAVGFETNTRANAPGQTDELVNWLLGTGSGPGQYQTNRAQQFYNISQVFYHPGSKAPASCTSPTSCFLEADVATAVLDSPTRNVPTWTMLFSPLPTPGSINPATGTGYHVTIAGYGSTGTGATGSTTTGGFRRRVAENMLGALTSISARNLFLFGTAGTPSRPQLLYWLDFDDPARGTAAANPRDFNGFRDNALPREGTTGPGDSGGPLILDQTFSRPTILGVLSGGSTFFAGQPGGSYGTQSFYQPLFLYWDWIIANNPYRYVTATAGNKNWEDPTAWITTLDPAYQIISGGNLVNGLPTERGGTNQVTTPQFGEVCFQSPLNSATPPATNECLNLATGTFRNGVPNTPGGTSGGSQPTISIGRDEAAPDSVAIAAADQSPGQSVGSTTITRESLDGAVESSMAAPGYVDGPLPTPTLANGLPGATNFVPNNTNGDRLTGVSGRYYDVTLSNAGTVTLNSAVTIDRFSIAGAQSQLTVASGGSLSSLIDFNQVTGIVQNNGTITSGGDYFFLSGLLSGTGRVNAPFLTSVMGNFAPGSLTSAGTLTIGGNLVMASGSTYHVNIGSGQSDLIAVVANGAGTGTANLGGGLSVSISSGSTIRFGDVYTILTASNGYTGTFGSANALSAILRPTAVYGTNAVQLQITAVPYTTVVNGLSPIQAAFAAMLDGNRTNPALNGIFNVLDLQDTATIRSTLEALAPRTETLRWALGRAGIESSNRLIRNRLLGLNPGVSGGSIAYLGNPMRTASTAYAMGRGVATPVMAAAGAADTRVREGRLPDNVSAFFAGGYLDGDSAPMPTALPAGGRDQFNGWYIGAGAEVHTGDNGAVGLAVSYTDLTGKAVGGLGSADGSLIQGSLYAKVQLGRIAIDGQFSAGVLSMNTSRSGALPATPYTLTSSDDALALSGEVNISAMFGSSSLQFGPSAGLRWSRLDFGRIVERGGPTALVIDQENHRAFEGRAGFNLMGTGRVRPTASVHYVHAFRDQPTFFNGFFVGGAPTTFRSFAVAGSDRNWADASLGLAFKAGKADIAVSADTTLARSDFDYQTYRASISFKF
jgi:hypothetical protein